MDRVRVITLLRRLGARQPDLSGGACEHVVRLDPLAQADVVQESFDAPLLEPARPERALLLVERVPEQEETQKVRPLVGERLVGPVGLVALLGGSLSRILDAERRSDDQRLTKALIVGSGEDDPADPRVHGQTCELPAQVRELESRAVLGVFGFACAQGAEFDQRLLALADHR